MDGSGNIKITMTRDSKGKANPTVLESKKFTIIGSKWHGLDLDYINERLGHSLKGTYKVEFLLWDAKAKIYVLANIEGLETVAECKKRLENESLDRERLANVNSGLGNLTNEEVKTQKAKNKAKGLGELTDAQCDDQRNINEKNGLGKITDEQVKSQVARNKNAGLGEFTDPQLDKQRENNERAGLGRVTDEQVKNQKSRNKASGLGDITDTQVANQKSSNRKNGLGEITDEQARKQKSINSANGLGDLTDEQVRKQKSSNKANGLGEITDSQVASQRSKNKGNGLGDLTDEQVKSQKLKNKNAGLGEFTDPQLDKQRENNERAGLGRVTDEQVKNQKAKNRAAGKGDYTDAQYAVKLKEDSLKEVRKYESKKQWIHALGLYYDMMEADPTENSKYLLDEYNKIANAIKEGKPGPGSYDAFSLYDGWKALCKEYEDYWMEQESIYNVTASKLTKGDLDYSTRTGRYSLKIGYKYTVDTWKYSRFWDLVKEGYKKAYKSDWSGMDSYWPREGYTKDRTYNTEFVITDVNGKNLMGDKTYTVTEPRTIGISGVSQSAMSTIDSGEYKIKITSIYRMDNSVREMVKIPGKDYSMSATEITQKQYEAVMGANPSFNKGDNLPVENVSWYDAIMFCNLLSVKDGLTPVYAVDGKTDTGMWNYTPQKGSSISGNITQDLNANGYRLPTVEEWEHAARGGQSYTYAGSNDLDEVGWYYGNSGGRIHEVGKKKANGYGLYDMSGNVWEWCWDVNSRYAGNVRYYCGGSCSSNYSNDCKVDFRNYRAAYSQGYYDGFRILRSNR